jgi:hypothetical protein
MQKRNLFVRFYLYQKERFPFLTHGILIGVFTFSAISYSRLSSGLDTFIGTRDYLLAVFHTITLFFLLRISDEHKDAADDLAFRKYLPVPRGLISLKELRYFAFLVIFLQLGLQGWLLPKMLIPYALVMLYMFFMLQEFWVAEWLKKHQFWYVVSHMFIIPFVDIYASGYDWFLEDRSAPKGLLFFFAVSFFNGVVLEIGRKIKSPENEEPGVVSYSGLLGRSAPWIWYILVCVTGAFAMLAAWFANLGSFAYVALSILMCLCVYPVIWFWKSPGKATGKFIEHASGIWTILMYLILGAAPMIEKLWR